MYTHICVYIYIYIYRERERDNIYIYIYIYIHIIHIHIYIYIYTYGSILLGSLVAPQVATIVRRECTAMFETHSSQTRTN